MIFAPRLVDLRAFLSQVRRYSNRKSNWFKIQLDDLNVKILTKIISRKVRKKTIFWKLWEILILVSKYQKLILSGLTLMNININYILYNTIIYIFTLSYTNWNYRNGVQAEPSGDGPNVQLIAEVIWGRFIIVCQTEIF